MRAAILFDSLEMDSVANHPEICGREIYLYALETFYAHSDIDCIFYACEFADMASYISVWKKKYDADKPVKVLHGIHYLMQLWLHILQTGQEKPDLYILQDVRFPLVTREMISDTVKMAGEYGIAMISGYTEETLYQIQKGKVEIVKDTGYLRYPAAVRADSPALHCLDRKERILEELYYYKPYLCESPDENIPVYSRQDREKAEAAIRLRNLEIQGATPLASFACVRGQKKYAAAKPGGATV